MEAAEFALRFARHSTAGRVEGSQGVRRRHEAIDQGAGLVQGRTAEAAQGKRRQRLGNTTRSKAILKFPGEL